MKITNQIIEELLQKFRPVIGPDYDKYRNHVYRVYINCILLDNCKGNEEKYAVAVVFHDIGIWTNHTINYLDPSVEQAGKYLIAAGKQEWLNEISLMIHWHHKWTKYDSDYENTVENFRKADWIDVSLGFIRFGISKKILAKSRQEFPNLGFHFFLLKKLANNFLRHPLNPLPMFTR